MLREDPLQHAENVRRAALRRFLFPGAPPTFVDVDPSHDAPSSTGAGSEALGQAGVVNDFPAAHTDARVKPSVSVKRPREAADTVTAASSSTSTIGSTALITLAASAGKSAKPATAEDYEAQERAKALARHRDWKIKKVLLDHQGWVRCVAFDTTNEWFATGSVDTVIKIWDTATGRLRANYTGHKEGVRGLAVSKLSPYLFSCGEDHAVKCWDLESSRVIRDYHGHKGSVNAIGAHTKIDIVATGSRDKTVKVWDIRTRQAVQTMVGHRDAVLSIAVQDCEPQIISGGADAAIYLWDLRTGTAITNLTRHRKPVEALVAHPSEETLVSAAADNVRKWKLPMGEFFTNMHHETVGNAGAEGRWCCASLNAYNELCVGGSDGAMRIYHWTSGILLQDSFTKAVKGGDRGIYACAFDASGELLVTGEADKTVKIWERKPVTA